MQEWGFELPDGSISDNARVKYIEFLLAAASGKVEGETVPGKIATPFERTKVAAYTLGAMAPCMRLYSFISREIQALLHPDDSSHIYKKWIESYSSLTFEVRHIICCIYLFVQTFSQSEKKKKKNVEVAAEIFVINTR
jgi:hypothetical protein